MGATEGFWAGEHGDCIFLEVDSGSIVEDGVEASEVSAAAVQARARRFHMKTRVLGALEIWQQIFAFLLGV